MIIVQIGGRQIGLIGDRVLDIVSVDAAQIQPVPRTTQGETVDFLSGLVTHDNTMIALIDLPNLLAVSEAEGASLAAVERTVAAPAKAN